jgi:hypothetical protein
MGVYDPMPRSSTGKSDGDEGGGYSGRAGDVKMVNGRPVYRLRGGGSGGNTEPLYLSYSSRSDIWFITDYEADMEAGRARGGMSVASASLTADKISGTWQVWAGENGCGRTRRKSQWRRTARSELKSGARSKR